MREETDRILLQGASAGASLDDLAAIAACAMGTWRAQQPDADEPDPDDRCLRLGTTFGDAGVIRGDLTPECATAVRAVLEALGKKAGRGRPDRGAAVPRRPAAGLRAAAPRLPDRCGLYLALAFHDSCARQILTTMSLAYVGAHAGHLDGRIMGAIHDWATPENLQPEPITVEIWRDLPEEFCRQVEVVNGQAVRCEAPRRTHQAAARRLAAVLEAAAADYVALHPGACLDVSNDFDVILWEVPAATIRRPDLALHNCAPDDVRPLPASYIRVIIEVVSPGSDKTDRVEKMGEYASAGIPFYWLVWISDNRVASVDVYVLDHAVEAYRLLRTLAPEDEVSVLEVPVRIKVPWSQLSALVR